MLEYEAVNLLKVASRGQFCPTFQYGLFIIMAVSAFLSFFAPKRRVSIASMTSLDSFHHQILIMSDSNLILN